jgi:prevent-host-death family protein
MKIGLREANQRFAKIMKVVRDGEEVTLTDHGRAVARIIPIVSPESEDAVVQRLAARGLIRPATKPWRMPPFVPRPIRGASVAQAIREERDSSDDA